MPREFLTVTGRLERSHDGGVALALDASSCAACAGCLWRGGTIGNLEGLVDARGLPAGASLSVRLPVTALVGAAVLIYGVPLTALLLGALAGASLAGGHDAAAVAGAIAGLSIGAAVLRKLRTRLERRVCGRLDVSGR